jgi:large subunit ribosomal protein L19
MKKIQQKQLNHNFPSLGLGDNIRIRVSVQEGKKQRVQSYQGIVIASRPSGIKSTITVWSMFQGMGVERVFFLNSPLVQHIEILRRGTVRRSKLYYLRNLKGNAIRLRERFVKISETYL